MEALLIVEDESAKEGDKLGLPDLNSHLKIPNTVVASKPNNFSLRNQSTVSPFSIKTKP